MKFIHKFLALCAFLLLAKACFAVGLTTPTTLAPMLKKVMPAVVNVQATGEIVLPDALVQQLQEQAPPGTHIVPLTQKFHALGSGVVINANQGYIVTNAHVVRDAKTITVNLSDGRTFPAKLVGIDTATDIAVLKIPADHLHSIVIGDSTELQIGDFVVAIGNPFGLNQTVTSGIVSALKRNDLNIEGYENFIQTDAPINPGNSGGALVNAQGELIGINTAILSTSGGNLGIGFAIPINMAQDVADQLIHYGKIERGTLGVYGQALTPQLDNALGLAPTMKGVVITAVNPNSAASSAGLKVTDIITKINDQTINDPFQLRAALGLVRAGVSIKITILRNGKTLTMNARLTEASAEAASIKQNNPLYGVELQMVQQATNAQQAVNGALVTKIDDDSVAAQAGLLQNDVIVSINNQAITSIEQLHHVVDSIYQSHKPLLLNIRRDDGALFIVIDAKS